MPVPDFQSFMLPILQLCGDGGDHTLSEAYSHLASLFALSDQDLRELVPSGRHTRFQNRAQWAKTHLTKAGVLEMTSRARFRITARGQELLGEAPSRIDLRLLRRYEEFREFRQPGRGSPAPVDDGDPGLCSDTPYEAIAAAYQRIRSAVEDDLLSRVLRASPEFFERLVVDLLVRMGYGGSRRDAGERVGRAGDGGIDGVIKEDLLGLDTVYIQAKRWQQPVGRPDVQAFAGSLMGMGSRKGVFLTTSQFTADAARYAEGIQEPRIILVDGATLAQLMLDHDVGVSETDRYIIKQVDSDYFEGSES